MATIAYQIFAYLRNRSHRYVPAKELVEKYNMMEADTHEP